MNFNIMLLNAMTFSSKKTGEVLSRIGYIFTDKQAKTNGQKFKGYGEQCSFYSGTGAFERIPFDWMGKQVIAHCEERGYPSNPLETRKVIVSLEFDGKVIDLL